MNKIKQYRPAFFTGFPDLLEIEFDTVDELLAIPFVASWQTDPEFYKFSICGRDGYGKMLTLICEQDEGASWWVVGFLDSDVPSLPAWDWKVAFALRDAKDRRP